MENACKMFDFIIDDSDDEKVINFVKSLTEEEVEGEASSSRVPRTRVYIARDREDAAVRERLDAVGRQSLTILQKCTAAIRQMTYGTTPDMLDEYIKVGEKTAALCQDNFCRCEQKHGLPGMLGSIDCMHWEWKNCPIAWQGQYTRGDQKGPSIMLEAVASQYLWIWHAFFGMAGANNDINVLNYSPLFNTIKEGTAPPSPFNVNGHHYDRGYYLGDGIYPDWTMLVKAPHNPIDEHRKKFKRFQESARKDIERAFGVLQGRFAMLKTPTRSKDFNKIRRHMYACVVLHNMIQENNSFVISEREIAHPSNRPIRLERNLRD
ncbi:protein ALP1-like [Rutidosis leptorrhynchoides]|uniref:protein ALP1-like n=1 Tax=Rutidosis leptorrhynchoides TaxID=125765 RepID=UPI003A99E91E